MNKIIKVIPVIIALALTVSLVGAPETHATSFSFTGNFTRDDNVRLFNFSLLNNASVSIDTTSYATGGFDPTLTPFDSTGVFIDQSQDLSLVDLDCLMTDTLLAGSYIVALTQYDNFPVADDRNNKLLAAGFTRQGAGNFTGPEFFTTGGPGSFINIDGLQRTSEWAVDIQGVDDASRAPVPEPATFILYVAGLAGIYALRKVKKPHLRTV